MALHQPHHVRPHDSKIRVLFIYKNFAAKAGVSHIGLGVSIANTMRVLQRHGIWAEVVPVVSPKDAAAVLAAKFQESQQHQPPQAFYSHVVFSAPWVPADVFQQLAWNWPNTTFVSLCHSNVGFLQVDTQGVRNIRHYLDLEHSTHNFRVAGNNERFVEWLQRGYRAPCAYLPNLYDLHGTPRPHRRPWDGSVLRIGCFGAIRPQKNLMTSVGAALEIFQTMRADTEIYLSSGRPENAHTIARSIHEMVDDIPGLKLIDNGWQTWPAFRRTVRQMDLMLQPSYSETFNIVTADGIAEGVPSVVSDAIEWAPKSWMAEVDDPSDIARKGCHLLQDHQAAHDGWEALTAYVDRGVQTWKSFLGCDCRC